MVGVKVRPFCLGSECYNFGQLVVMLLVEQAVLGVALWLYLATDAGDIRCG